MPNNLQVPVTVQPVTLALGPVAQTATPKKGLPWWAWLLIAFGVLTLCVLCLALLGGIVFFATLQPVAALPPVVQQPVIAPTEPPAAIQPQCYALNGQSYESPQGSLYNAVWTCDGRLWQPQLPPGNERIAHTVAITIEEGNYAFDGVECQLFVDSARNGAGASNPVTAEYGNDLHFTVDTADGGQAWALVQCRGNFSSGFQIRWLGK